MKKWQKSATCLDMIGINNIVKHNIIGSILFFPKSYSGLVKITGWKGSIFGGHFAKRVFTEYVDDWDVDDNNIFDDLSALLIQYQIPGFPGYWSTEDEDDNTWLWRRPNKSRTFAASYGRFDRLYFSIYDLYGESAFERRFGMSCSFFLWIDKRLHGRGIFLQRLHATEWPVIHLPMRITAALRMLAHSMCFDQADGLCELGVTTVRESFIAFVCQFSPHYYQGASELRIKPSRSVLSASPPPVGFLDALEVGTANICSGITVSLPVLYS